MSFWHWHIRESSNHRFPDPRVLHRCIWHLNSCPNRQRLQFPQCPGKKRHGDDEFRSIWWELCKNWGEHEKQKALRMLGCFQCSRYALYVSVAKLLWILSLRLDVVLLNFMRCLWHLQPTRTGLLCRIRHRISRFVSECICIPKVVRLSKCIRIFKLMFHEHSISIHNETSIRLNQCNPWNPAPNRWLCRNESAPIPMSLVPFTSAMAKEDDVVMLIAAALRRVFSTMAWARSNKYVGCVL